MIETLSDATTSAESLSGIVPAIDLPNPEPQQPPGFEKLGEVLGAWMWLSLLVLIFALVGFGMLLWYGIKRGDGFKDLAWALGILVGAIVVTAASSLIGWIAG